MALLWPPAGNRDSCAGERLVKEECGELFFEADASLVFSLSLTAGDASAMVTLRDALRGGVPYTGFGISTCEAGGRLMNSTRGFCSSPVLNRASISAVVRVRAVVPGLGDRNLVCRCGLELLGVAGLVDWTGLCPNNFSGVAVRRLGLGELPDACCRFSK